VPNATFTSNQALVRKVKLARARCLGGLTLEESMDLPSELTAENGAKLLLIGEFHETVTIQCEECEGCGLDDDLETTCEVCDGAGEQVLKVFVSWTTIKEIYKKIVEHYGND
jgi:Zn finger protein HypA/HybF involved in hydrogenase expression